jgi:2Fe-2S ferredoxin
MAKITYIAHTGESQVVDVPVGWSVMEGAVQNDVMGIVAECGGGCACATCHVYVDAAWIDRFDAPASMEQDMLECTAAERTERSRLSCQLKVTEACDGLIVHLPESQT